jgi:hypothetical protein
MAKRWPRRRLAESDLDWLNRTTHEVPRHTEKLAEFHRSRVSGLLNGSQRLIGAIVALYAAFIVVGWSLVAAASLAANRGIAPVAKARGGRPGIADGRLRPGSVTSRTIRLLPHSTSWPSGCRRTRTSCSAHGARGEGEEARALYEIGVEISRLQKPTGSSSPRWQRDGATDAVALSLPGAESRGPDERRPDVPSARRGGRSPTGRGRGERRRRRPGDSA